MFCKELRYKKANRQVKKVKQCFKKKCKKTLALLMELKKVKETKDDEMQCFCSADMIFYAHLKIRFSQI